MDMLLEVAKSLEANENIHFVLVGNGAYLEQVKQIVADRNISNVHLSPPPFFWLPSLTAGKTPAQGPAA